MLFFQFPQAARSLGATKQLKCRAKIEEARPTNLDRPWHGTMISCHPPPEHSTQLSYPQFQRRGSIEIGPPERWTKRPIERKTRYNLASEPSVCSRRGVDSQRTIFGLNFDLPRVGKRRAHHFNFRPRAAPSANSCAAIFEQLQLRGP